MNSSSVKGSRFDISDRKYFVQFVLEVSRVTGFLWEDVRSSLHAFLISMASKRVNHEL